jgi:hypothetical protein
MTASLLILKDLISFAEAARIRGISRQAMSRLVAKSRFSVVTIGDRGFLSRKEIENYVPLKAGRPCKSAHPEMSDEYEKAVPRYLKVAEDPPKQYSSTRQNRKKKPEKRK